jgi:hypothetical protein
MSSPEKGDTKVDTKETKTKSEGGNLGGNFSISKTESSMG